MFAQKNTTVLSCGNCDVSLVHTCSTAKTKGVYVIPLSKVKYVHSATGTVYRVLRELEGSIEICWVGKSYDNKGGVCYAPPTSLVTLDGKPVLGVRGRSDLVLKPEY